MAKEEISGRPVGKIVRLAEWLTGILVSLAVGFGMISGILTIPWLGSAGIIVVWAGWIVVILTVISIVLAITNKF